MAKDHYLPAGFIGRFSNDEGAPYRDHRLWTHNSKAGKTLPVKANAIGYKKGLYNLQDGKTIDQWDYEGPLNRVLDSVGAAKKITLDDWIHIAVPFVAGLFVRGKEFNDRYESMPLLKNLAQSGVLPPDNTNGSRAFRLHRQLAPVMGTRWVVLHNKGDTALISNDLGLVLTQNAENGEVGWAIPLDSKTVLGIFPRKAGRIAKWEQGTWHAEIEHLHPPDAMFEGFNKQIARASNEFIFGANKSELETYAQQTGVEALDKLPIIMEGPWSQMFSGRELVAHENEWYTVATIANRNLDPKKAVSYCFDFEDLDIKNKWSPPIVLFATNLTSFPSGIGFSGNNMFLDLKLLDDFEKHIRLPNSRTT